MKVVYEKPTLQDIKEMLDLVQPEVQNGTILERNADEMATTIRSYYIARLEGKIVGFCALHIYSSVLAEVRSLVVDKDYRQCGIGKRLVELIIQEGKKLGIKEVLTLTYKDEFFKKLGFTLIEKTQIPNHKIWADCIKCKHFPKCEEIALIKQL